MSPAPKTVACIDDLPTEIVARICSSLITDGNGYSKLTDGTRSVANFARTSRRYFSIADPILYTHVKDISGLSVLCWAARKGLSSTISKALAAGSDVNVAEFSDTPYTPSRHRKCPSPTYSDYDSSDDEYGDEEQSRMFRAVRSERTGNLTLHHEDRPGKGYWWTPLHLAAFLGYGEIVQLLLSHGSSLEASSCGVCDCRCISNSRHGTHRLIWTPLHLSICSGNNVIAEILVRQGAKLDANIPFRRFLEYGISAFHTAAESGNTAMLGYLWESGLVSDIDTEDGRGNTAFAFACAAGRWDTSAPWLAERQANMDIKINGMSALSWACKRKEWSAATWLLERGASANPVLSDFEPYPLLICCEAVETPAAEAQVLPLIEQLISKGADTNRMDHRGYAALAMASESRCVPLIDLLLKSGVDFGTGVTPYAAPMLRNPWRACDEIFAILLLKGIPVEWGADDGWSALVYACRRNCASEHMEGRGSYIETLLKRGANPNIKVRYGNDTIPLLESCLQKGFYENCELLIRYGADYASFSATELCFTVRDVWDFWRSPDPVLSWFGYAWHIYNVRKPEPAKSIDKFVRTNIPRDWPGFTMVLAKYNMQPAKRRDLSASSFPWLNILYHDLHDLGSKSYHTLTPLARWRAALGMTEMWLKLGVSPNMATPVDGGNSTTALLGVIDEYPSVLNLTDLKQRDIFIKILVALVAFGARLDVPNTSGRSAADILQNMSHSENTTAILEHDPPSIPIRLRQNDTSATLQLSTDFDPPKWKLKKTSVLRKWLANPDNRFKQSSADGDTEHRA